MRYSVFLYLFFTFISHVRNLGGCDIDTTAGAKSYEDCKDISPFSSGKTCCYVKGEDDKGNAVSSCYELGNNRKDALVDLHNLETFSYHTYYLDADCNFGSQLQICSPNIRKSTSPLSVEQCAQYPVVSITGISTDSSCCYVTGVNQKNQNIHTCVKVSKYLYTEEYQKKELEAGNYKHLGPLRDVEVMCSESSGSYKFYSLIKLINILMLVSFFI
jgi:hypothetical protein